MGAKETSRFPPQFYLCLADIDNTGHGVLSLARWQKKLLSSNPFPCFSPTYRHTYISTQVLKPRTNNIIHSEMTGNGVPRYYFFKKNTVRWGWRMRKDEDGDFLVISAINVPNIDSPSQEETYFNPSFLYLEEGNVLFLKVHINGIHTHTHTRGIYIRVNKLYLCSRRTLVHTTLRNTSWGSGIVVEIHTHSARGVESIHLTCLPI